MTQDKFHILITQAMKIVDANRTVNNENRTLKTELHNLIADKTGGY
jgi:hypothetical protein